MSYSRGCRSTDSENMREIIYKNSATLAPIEVLALLISLKSANSLLWIKFLTQNTFLGVFASIPTTVLDTLGSIYSSKQLKVIN
jgi:hypothetical protein